MTNLAIQTKAINTRGGSKIRVKYGAASASFNVTDHAEGARLFMHQFGLSGDLMSADLDDSVRVHIVQPEAEAAPDSVEPAKAEPAKAQAEKPAPRKAGKAASSEG